MAHLAENKAGVTGLQSAASAAKMMDSAKAGMRIATMEKGVPAMMGMGKGMMPGMEPMMGMGKNMMSSMGQAMNPAKTTGVIYGVALSAGVGAGKSALRKVFTHPVTLIGLGFVVGYLAHKYRKTIVVPPSEISPD